MKNFIYLNSNQSGIGDRLTDLMLVFSYSLFLGYEHIYLHWTENSDDMTGNDSYYSRLRRLKTSFREKDYLLKNLTKYLILPENIHFTNMDNLNAMTKDNNNFIYTEYTGMRYTLYTFMNILDLSNDQKERFSDIYFKNFNKIKFKNIPDEIINYFEKNDVITVHLRRGDKICDDGGTTNNVQEKDLEQLDKLTIKCINQLIDMNYKNFNFVSDEKKYREYYINLFKNKVNCITFDGDSISQTYYDIYCLANSEKILLSQVFSVFSILSSFINNNDLYYFLEHSKMEKFSEYKNIKNFYKEISINRKIFDKKLLIHKFNIYDYPFEQMVKKCFENYFKEEIKLDELHNLLENKLINKEDKNYFNSIPEFGKNDRKSIFNKIFYNYYDNNDEFKNLYIKFIKNFIKPIFFSGEDYLVIQKTPNIRQHLPNTTTIGRLSTDPDPNLIGIHTDGNFGHSEEEYNFILPITRMFETNSIYFEPYKNSEIDFNDYLNVNLNIDELGCYYFNKCFHYNKINKTGKTRISFDFRIIPYSRYYTSDYLTETDKKKLIIGEYFLKI